MLQRPETAFSAKQGRTNMAHGYLGDGYGTHGEVDPDSERRDRDEDWRERGWRGGGDWRERDRDRDRGMMFGSQDRDEWRGGRRSWWGEDRGGRGWFESETDLRDDRRSFSAHPDDHYRSWRDRHMSELDRDYRDYCQEREQQFHRDFDDWRRQKYSNPQPLRTGMTQTGMSHDPSGETQALAEGSSPADAGSDPTDAATLGTNSTGGRNRR
jgi:hypothetical protein